jgi:predicted outer membrane repeat protein
MRFNEGYRHWQHESPMGRRPSARASTRPTVRLNLEPLEDRMLPSNYAAATVSDLIADINAANLAGGSNTITLAPKTTFTLTTVNNTTDGGNGLPVIAANNNLTIDGNSDTIQRKSSSPAFRIFDVAGRGSLALANLTLQNGTIASPGGSGGCIFNSGTLSVSGCTLSGNSASVGGAIFNNNGGQATVQSSTLCGNSGNQGGGILNFGSMMISGCTVSRNSATQNGGGIHNEGSMTITGTTVSRNDGRLGGGIYTNGMLFISNSLVCSNSAALGADLYYNCGAFSVTISNSTICKIYNNCL